ncbi:MAG: Pr6Pr family membrane protein [Clostridia bacterium]|nr:Pr6Pr family membrane protein [Clostridia bacterium]
MFAKNLIVQMIYRIVLCCVSALAVLLTFGLFYAGKGPNTLTWEFLKYYTNISNYFVFAVSVIVLNDNVKRVMAGEKEGYNRKVRTLKFMTTVMILVTFLVYATLLGKPFTADFWRNIGNLSYHVFAPLLFIIDYFLFEEKKSVSVFAPLLSLIIPLVYVCYVFILGAAVKNFEYPYFFLDVNDLGYGGVMVWVVILVAVFTVLGYLLWLYNRIMIENGKLKVDFKNIKWLKMPQPSAATPAAEIAATDQTDDGETAE